MTFFLFYTFVSCTLKIEKCVCILSAQGISSRSAFFLFFFFLLTAATSAATVGYTVYTHAQRSLFYIIAMGARYIRFIADVWSVSSSTFGAPPRDAIAIAYSSGSNRGGGGDTPRV